MDKRLAWWAFGLALAGFLGVTALAALVIALYALSVGAKARGLLVAGMVLASVWLVAAIGLTSYSVDRATADGHGLAGIAARVRDTGQISPFGLKKGQCFDDDSVQLDGAVRHTKAVAVRDCDEPHLYEVFAVEETFGSRYPGDEVQDARVRGACEAAFVATFRHSPAWDRLGVAWFYPEAEQWDVGQRRIVCSVTRADGSPATGPIGDVLGKAKASKPKDVYDLGVGECYNPVHSGLAVDVWSVNVRSCAGPHEKEILAIGKTRPSWVDYPGVDPIEKLVTRKCERDIQYQLAPGLEDADIYLAWWSPTGASWEEGDRTLICTIEWSDGKAHPGRIARPARDGA